MPEFKFFKAVFSRHFQQLTAATHLFEVDVDKDELWETYLKSFPEGTNPIFRERTVHDCSCCRSFIRAAGGIVAIRDNKICTVWDFKTGETTYQPVVDALANLVRSKAVNGVYLTRNARIGTNYSTEFLRDGTPIRWEHLYAELPERHVYHGNATIGDRQNEYRTSKAVFKRGLDEITPEAIATVLELIAENSLYRGAEFKGVVEKFSQYKQRYLALPEDEKDNFCWVESINAGPSVAKIRNHAIGTLLNDLSNGEDIEDAVRKFEAVMAPENYKRPQAIVTPKTIEAAKKKVTDLGLLGSLQRRYATLDDIKLPNVLFANRDAVKRMTGNDVFSEMIAEVQGPRYDISRAEEIHIDDFVSRILPGATEVEVYLEPRHSKNLVSLIAPVNEDSKTMFKWPNPYSWAYTGNGADSSLKERVKAAGGKVDGALRFSMQWNDTDDYSGNDLDAHCIEPNGNHICYYHKVSPCTGGNLDVDITHPLVKSAAVENITWPDKNRMDPGTYRLFVRQYANRGGRDGFRSEIEFDGQIYAYDYPHELRQDENVQVAEVILGKDGRFRIDHKLKSTSVSRDMWGIKTNAFVPVSTIMFSPNYWDNQRGIGNKHFFFFLKGCINTETPHGWYNEYLKDELLEHKRVFEVLGGKMSVETVPDQLSGVGFSSTKRDSMIVAVTSGKSKKILKINF